MKKLMIAAVVMACAIASQAASMNWTYNAGTDTQIGYNVYMILGASAKTDWANASEIASASISQGTVSQQKSGMSTFYMTGNVLVQNDSLLKTSSIYYVLVKDDGSQFAVTTPAVPNDSGIYVYGQQDFEGSTYELAGKFGAFQDFAGGDVPEPTSAMLLLLGVAGLALRRRRA